MEQETLGLYCVVKAWEWDEMESGIYDPLFEYVEGEPEPSSPTQIPVGTETDVSAEMDVSWENTMITLEANLPVGAVCHRGYDADFSWDSDETAKFVLEYWTESVPGTVYSGNRMNIEVPVSEGVAFSSTIADVAAVLMEEIDMKVAVYAESRSQQPYVNRR